MTRTPSRLNAGAAGAARVASREARRRQLIDATLRSIAEHGFSGTTLASVTQGAGLSHGTVHFHFDNKQDLFDKTFEYIAAEHHGLVADAMRAAGPSPAAQLAAIIEADFSAAVCVPNKLNAWVAFWGQAAHREKYRHTQELYDERRSAEIYRLCAEIAAEDGDAKGDGGCDGGCDGGHDGGRDGGRDGEQVARWLEAMIDGLWLQMLQYPDVFTPETSLRDTLAWLGEMFPQHFPVAER